VLSASYVGSQNRHQNYYSETDLVNQGLLAGFQANSAGYNAAVPYLGYHSIKMAQNEANGDYNSLQISMRGTLAKSDLNYQFGYTLARANDSFNNGSSGGDLYQISDPYKGWKYDFGPSNFDHENVFFANFVYQIPLLKNSQNKLLKTTLGGWEVAGIITAESGAPLNIGLNGQNVSSIVPNTQNRPDQSGAASNPHTVNEWFDTSIYSVPAAGTWGNASHNSVWGPGRDNWNLSLYKNFVFSEARGSSLQFRAEFYNIWNHTQWIGDTQNGGISTNASFLKDGSLDPTSNFGHVTNAYDPRVIQLALKLFF